MLLLLLLMLLLLPADSLRAEQLLLRYHQFFPHVGHLKQEGKYTMFVQASPITVTPVTVTLFGRPSTVTVGWEGLYVSFGLMGGINMVCCVATVWGGRLSKMFCNMFSESSTGSWAELQQPCCPNKQGELPENMLRNLLLNLPPQTVVPSKRAGL